MTLENLQKVLTALQAQIPSTAFIGNREDDDPVVLCIDVVQDAIKLSELDTPIGVISEDLLPKSPIFRKKSEIVLSKEQIAQIMNPPKTTFSKNDRPKLYAAAEEMLEESCGNQEAALAKYIETAESLGCGVIVIDAAPPRGEVIIQKQGEHFMTWDEDRRYGRCMVGPCDQEVGQVYVPVAEPKP